MVVNFSATGSITDFISFIFTRTVFNSFTNEPFCSTRGDTNNAPILANAAFTFERAPVNVSLAFLACSPKASSIAAANVSKEILPLDTMSRTSASVLFKYEANVAAAFIPLEESDKRSSPIKRP